MHIKKSPFLHSLLMKSQLFIMNHGYAFMGAFLKIGSWDLFLLNLQTITIGVVIESIYNIMLNILIVQGRPIKSNVGMKLQNFDQSIKK